MIYPRINFSPLMCSCFSFSFPLGSCLILEQMLEPLKRGQVIHILLPSRRNFTGSNIGSYASNIVNSGLYGPVIDSQRKATLPKKVPNPSLSLPNQRCLIRDLNHDARLSLSHTCTRTQNCANV